MMRAEKAASPDAPCLTPLGGPVSNIQPLPIN